MGRANLVQAYSWASPVNTVNNESLSERTPPCTRGMVAKTGLAKTVGVVLVVQGYDVSRSVLLLDHARAASKDSATTLTRRPGSSPIQIRPTCSRISTRATQVSVSAHRGR